MIDSDVTASKTIRLMKLSYEETERVIRSEPYFVLLDRNPVSLHTPTLEWKVLFQ